MKLIINLSFCASCECGQLKFSSRRIPNYWSHKYCENCEKKLCVYNNKKELIYNYNNTSFTAVCECGELNFKSKSITNRWSQEKCQNCYTKLTIYNEKKEIVCDYSQKIKKQIFKKKQIAPYSLYVSKIKNDVFMGDNSFENYPSHLITNSDIDMALDLLIESDLKVNCSYETPLEPLFGMC